MVKSVSGMGTSELHRCSLQMMWFCWLHQFAVECEVVGMRVSTSKSKAMVLCRKTVDCPLYRTTRARLKAGIKEA